MKQVVEAYQESIEQVLGYFSTDSSLGLSAQEAAKRLEKFGVNKLPDKPRPTLFFIFLDQFKNPLIYILLIAASIIFFTGNHIDAFILSGVLIFNAVMGTIQEGKTQNLLDSLRQSIKTSCIIIRDHKRTIIGAEHLVPGDIVVFQEGERVPADIRVIQSTNLTIDEAMLTGESTGVVKTTAPLQGELPVHDQTNMAFKGTFVISGSGKGVVVAIGAETAIGKLQKVVEGIQTETPLKKELHTLSYHILIFILVVCVFLFGIGLAYGKSFTQLLIMLTALFICVVPEGLPVVLTLILVTGAQRMAKKGVLVKKLRGVDSLGRTEVAVIDKTGTLTRNELMVSRIYTEGSLCKVTGQGYFTSGAITCDKDTAIVTSSLEHMAAAAILLNHAEVEYEEQRKTFLVEGDPTEAALAVFGEKYGFNEDDLKERYTFLFEIPFSSSYGYHAMFFKDQQVVRAFIIGSPESITARCPDSTEADEKVLSVFLDEGLRTVAAGIKEFDERNLDQQHELSFFQSLLKNDVHFLGFFGLEDTLREEIPPIVDQVRNAKLQVVMATGDHQKTALFIAKKAGIFKEGDEIIDGSEFRTMSDEKLLSRLDKTTVYSRVTPEDKLHLISLLHEEGKVVAMTGDGVNDAPALVAADVGIAMGGIGTEVAKDASDVILLDDSFAHVVRAIEQGRHIFYTLRRVILYFFATNLGEVFVVLFALVLNYPLPILAAQILWLNLVTDGFLDLALAMEPEEKGLLQKKRPQRGSRITDFNLFLKTVYMALPMGIGSILMFRHFYSFDLAKARTITLITMALYQWFNAWNCRSETKSLVSLGFFSNRWLLLATSFVGLLQVLVVYVPFLQIIFHTVPISAKEFGLIVLVTAPLLLIEELRKLVVRLFFARNVTRNI